MIHSAFSSHNTKCYKLPVTPPFFTTDLTKKRKVISVSVAIFFNICYNVMRKTAEEGISMSFDINEQYDKIYRYCFLKVRHKETAEDITQETFLRYLEHPDYKSVDKTLQLLYTIAGNLCTDEFRRKKAAELSETDASDEDIEDSVLSGFELKQALEKLSDSDREIILLRYINEVPVNVIAKMQNISRFALNRRINRILTALHEYMGKEELT